MFVISISELELRLGDDSSTCTCEVLWSHGPFALESNRNTIDHNGSQIKQLIIAAGTLKQVHKLSQLHSPHPFSIAGNTETMLAKVLLWCVKLVPFWAPQNCHFGDGLNLVDQSEVQTLQLPSLTCNACGYMWGANVEFWSAIVGMLKSCVPTARTLKMKPHHY